MGFAIVGGAVRSPLLTGPGPNRLEGIVHDPGGDWILVGVSSPAALLAGDPIDSLGGADVLVLGLDQAMRLQWQRALGGGADDEALGVELDPVTGDVIVLGLTTAPTDVDPDGRLLDGQQGIFVHRFPAPAH